MHDRAGGARLGGRALASFRFDGDRHREVVGRLGMLPAFFEQHPQFPGRLRVFDRQLRAPEPIDRLFELILPERLQGELMIVLCSEPGLDETALFVGMMWIEISCPRLWTCGSRRTLMHGSDSPESAASHMTPRTSVASYGGLRMDSRLSNTRIGRHCGRNQRKSQ